ncbi:MAG: DUF177 domain-containing protein [Aquiluna sp.]|nr:DUF177 domain-containing protein [Aquiluna sp.]
MSFLVSIKELVRHPGNMRELTLHQVLEQPIGTPVARLVTGSQIEIQLRLESVHEGILATAEVFGTAELTCSRCLDEVKLEIEVDFQELFAYSSSSDDELVVDGEHIDLEQVVIDSVVLNLPFQPVCSNECLGLCAECGTKMNENPEHEHQREIDSRFEALKDLLSKEE